MLFVAMGLAFFYRVRRNKDIETKGMYAAAGMILVAVGVVVAIIGHPFQGGTPWALLI